MGKFARVVRLILLGPVVVCLCGGGGGVLGKGAAKAPDVPKLEATPSPEKAADPEAKAVRDDEARRLRLRRGVGGTVMTGALGTIAEPQTMQNTLLGKIGA